MNYNFWTAQEIDILKRNSAKMSFARMSRDCFPNRTPTSLQKKAVKMGLTSGYRHRDYTFNSDIWKVMSPQTAYYAGFLAADGNLLFNKKVCRIMLSAKDSCILEGFKHYTSSSHPIKLASRKRYRSEETMKVASISIAGCGTWFQDLDEIWSITPNKTFTLRPPNITDGTLVWPFILGAMDGDGHVSVTKRDGALATGLAGASLEFMQWVKFHIDGAFPIERYKYRRFNNKPICKVKNYYVMCFNGRRAAAIIDFLGRLPVSKLDRKWNRPDVLAALDVYRQKYPHLFLQTEHAATKLSTQS